MKIRKTALCAAVALLILLCPVLHVCAEIDDSVARVQCNEKLVALTFDDGPHPRYTDRVLKVLADHGVKATFFMIGQNVKYYPEAAKHVAEAGHEIGNHTYSHPHLSRVGEGELAEQIRKCDGVIREVTGVTPVLFRPPEGKHGIRQCALVQECGYRQVLWNVDTLDWSGCGTDKIIDRVLRNVSGGDIVLFHDYVGKKYHSADALEVIIPALQKDGYRFVTVSEMIAAGTPLPPTY